MSIPLLKFGYFIAFMSSAVTKIQYDIALSPFQSQYPSRNLEPICRNLLDIPSVAKTLHAKT